MPIGVGLAVSANWLATYSAESGVASIVGWVQQRVNEAALLVGTEH